MGVKRGQECPRSVVALLRRSALRQGAGIQPRYLDAEGALLGQFRHLHTDIYGNREFVEHLRNRASSSTTRKSERIMNMHYPGVGNGIGIFKFLT